MPRRETLTFDHWRSLAHVQAVDRIFDQPRRCEHQFRRFRRWPVKLRWRCIHCGEITRLYDTVDAMGTRPIDPHMSVAVKGYNTVD